MACRLIDILAKWKDERVFPAIIAFLEDDGFAYQMGDDIGIPALKARSALHKATGLWFPQDVAAAAIAWDKVRTIHDRLEREKLWKTLVEGVACPVKAVLERSGSNANVVLTNVTDRAVTVAKSPSEVNCRWDSAVGGGGYPECEEFKLLKPGESTRFKYELNPDLVRSGQRLQRLTLLYWNAGRKQHLKAWIGSVNVDLGNDSKRPAGNVSEKDTSRIDRAFRKDGAEGVVAAVTAIRNERGAAEAVKLLSRCLRDENIELRAAAATCLGNDGR